MAGILVRNRGSRSYFFACLLLCANFLPEKVHADEQTTTDAPQKIAEILTAFGPVPVTHHTPVVQHRRFCPGGLGRGGDETHPCHTDDVTVDQVTHSNDLLKVINLRIIRSDPVLFEPSVRTEVPSSLVVSGVIWVNCSATIALDPNDTLSVAFQRASSLSITHTVANAASAQVNFEWTATPALKIGGNVQVSKTTTDGTTDTTSYQQTITRSHGASTSVPARKAVAAEIQTWPVKLTSKFRTSVVVDGELSENDKYKRLSDIIPASARSFPITGSIGFTDAADAKVIFYDAKFDFSKCPSDQGKKLLAIPINNFNTLTVEDLKDQHGDK